MDRKALGRKIKTLRREKGFSQSDLAERLKVSYQQIQKYENGTSSLSLDRLIAISKALEILPEALLVEEKTEAYRAQELSPEEKRIIALLRSIDDRQVTEGILSQLEGTVKKIGESRRETSTI
jgi:transcriptional regulator with XRE-family HTH domain